MSRFPPKPEALTHVKMTRTAYAQLLGQKFFPPKIFSRWTEQEGTNQWRWRDVGMKIVWSKSSLVRWRRIEICIQAVGFEILYQESKGRQNLSQESIRSAVSASYIHLDLFPDKFATIRVRPLKKLYNGTPNIKNTSRT